MFFVDAAYTDYRNDKYEGKLKIRESPYKGILLASDSLTLLKSP